MNQTQPRLLSQPYREGKHMQTQITGLVFNQHKEFKIGLE